MIAAAEAAMLEEKLKQAIVAELERQADDRPQALKVETSPQLVVNGTVDLGALAVAGGP